MASPYDGTPDGNFLGASMDDNHRRFHAVMADAAAQDVDPPRTPLELLSVVVSVGIFLFMFLS
jgi:hypothetical protein